MTDENPSDTNPVSGANKNRCVTNGKSRSSDTEAIDHSVGDSLVSTAHETPPSAPPGMDNKRVDERGRGHGHDSSRGVRRPRPCDADQQHSRYALSASTIESTGQFGEHPANINPVDDVLPTDLLFHSRDPFDSVDTFNNSENLDVSQARSPSIFNEEVLKSTVDDVESSLEILTNEDTVSTGKQRLHQRPMRHRASTEQSNPLVFLKRGADKSVTLDSMLPAPLAIDDDQMSLSSALVSGIESARNASDSKADPAKSIENVADDAVRMMSRSINAAGGETLDATLAREIRVNLTQLLAEWQEEESQRRSARIADDSSSFEKPIT